MGWETASQRRDSRCANLLVFPSVNCVPEFPKAKVPSPPSPHFPVF